VPLKSPLSHLSTCWAPLPFLCDFSHGYLLQIFSTLAVNTHTHTFQIRFFKGVGVFFCQKHNHESTKPTRAANKEGGLGARSLFAFPVLLFPLGALQCANKNADHGEDGSGWVWGAGRLLPVVPREEGAERPRDKWAKRM